MRAGTAPRTRRAVRDTKFHQTLGYDHINFLKDAGCSDGMRHLCSSTKQFRKQCIAAGLVKGCKDVWRTSETLGFDTSLEHFNFNTALREACWKGEIEKLGAMLADKRVPNPGRDFLWPGDKKGMPSNTLLRIAIQADQPEVVRMLLDDKRIDPTLANNEALTLAVNDGFYDVFLELLDDKRIMKTLTRDYMNYLIDIAEGRVGPDLPQVPCPYPQLLQELDKRQEEQGVAGRKAMSNLLKEYARAIERFLFVVGAGEPATT